MAKKKTVRKGLESFTFKTFLKSLTIPKIKELFNRYTELALKDSSTKKLKGYSTLKKQDLVEFIDTNVENNLKKILYSEFEKDFVESLVSNALSLISGEHKVEKVQNAIIIAGGKGYNVWFSSKYGSHKASLQLVNKTVERDCNCKIGENQGLCLHQMAIYLMLIGKKVISYEELPFSVEKDFLNLIFKRLDLLATQSLFKEEPSILLEGDYKIYVNDDLVTLDWGGDYAGKSTKDISKEEVDVETWVTNKIVNLILKNIKVRAKEGQTTKLLLDNYNVVSKIMNREDLVNKILKKISVLDDPKLPKDENELEIFLKSNLKESSADFSIDPPFSAYMGDDPYIFVSYTHKDKAEVYPILKELHNKGFQIWYDEGIPLSTDWCNTIAEKLIVSKLFLSFISPHVLESDNTQDEIHLAMNEKKQFLAIYLKNTELNPGLKMRIRRVQGILKYEMDELRFYDKLTKNLGEFLES
ncbi:MAG: toll/interleukin-1 receptor domain-containing protein [Candidatus Lokiarchaeota archaeon]|nr:toll/interleukin-1 receptor domain-containing protein [Candidatus Lokiarchaeota archaeon]